MMVSLYKFMEPTPYQPHAQVTCGQGWNREAQKQLGTLKQAKALAQGYRIKLNLKGEKIMLNYNTHTLNTAKLINASLIVALAPIYSEKEVRSAATYLRD